MPSDREKLQRLRRRRNERIKEKMKSQMNERVLPQIWEGNTCFILGGGPSLLKVDFNLIKQRRVIAVNNAYGCPIKNEGLKSRDDWFNGTERYIPYDWIDFIWFGDGRWFDKHKKYLAKYKGLVAHCAPRIATKNYKGFYHFKRGKQYGIDLRPSYIGWNKSSGASAISFAYHLGVKRIVLLGFDMKRIDGKANWHTDHPSPDKNPYEMFLRAFPFIANDAKKLGLDIINCTVGSAINSFRIMELEEYLEWEKRK